MTDAELTHAVIGAAMEVHRSLGPGLLESVYEECLARELTLRDISYTRQKPLPLVYKDLKLECGYRLDLLVAGRVIVEIKAIENIAPIHETVMLTYLRLSNVRIGLLLNFHVPILKDGIRRIVWHYEVPDNLNDNSKDNAEPQSTQRSVEEAPDNAGKEN
jgi:GxxExxY protein